jgi:hypothetical protein
VLKRGGADRLFSVIRHLVREVIDAVELADRQADARTAAGASTRPAHSSAIKA